MRISDGSSDVCSSDLIRLTLDGRERRISYTWLDLEGKMRWFRNLVRPVPEDAQRWIDLDRPLYLHGLAYLSQDSGFFVRPPGTRSGLRQLLWGGFTYSELRKARDRKSTRLNSSH